MRGGVLLHRLARAGSNVVGFEAGPFWDTERDWVSDEKGSHQLYWNGLRITEWRASADYLISQHESILRDDPRDLTAPPVRTSLSPLGTFTGGAPHLR